MRPNSTCRERLPRAIDIANISTVALAAGGDVACTPPPFALDNHEWIINSQTRLFIGFTAYGWTGNWNRPFYVPQRGTFAFSKESVVEENRRVDGLITPFIGVRFKTEAEIVLNIQNANQGWLPNSVFLVENYPSPPLAIRVTGRWRMFN